MSAICERVACESSRAARRSAPLGAWESSVEPREPGGATPWSIQLLDAARESACFASALRCRASRSGHAWSRAHTNAPQFDPWRSDRIARARAETEADVPGRGARHRTCGDWGRSQRQRTRQGCPYFNCNRIYTCVDALYDVTRDGAPDRRTRPPSRRPPRGDGTRDRTGRARSCSRKERRRAGIHRR